MDAVRCAIEVQTGMVERNFGLPPERRIEYRSAFTWAMSSRRATATSWATESISRPGSKESRRPARFVFPSRHIGKSSRASI